MVKYEVSSIVITTVFLVLVVLVVTGNIVVCLIIKRSRQMRTPINYLLVNLAVSDILFATFIAPKLIFGLNLSHPEGATGSILCKLMTGGNFAWIPGVSSVVTLVTIAVERYYTVVHPMDPNRKMTKHKLKVILLCSWIFSVIFNIPLFLARTYKREDGKNHCVLSWPKKWMSTANCYAWLFLVVAAVGLMITLYSQVVLPLWLKPKSCVPLSYKQQGVIRVRKRITMMVITVSVIFAICWGAESVEYVLRTTTTLKITFVHIAIVDILVLFNSAVNPLVYGLLNHQFRQKIREVICGTRAVAPRQRTITIEENTSIETKL
ncbi:QRFP-like peptide receptor [Pocillopora verrucosa]|uniref:QRFP-like peptide receptor n=1 Tax=Pocillopora verrucosa TaxID=203993 RepID=UPI0027978C45|nr:tyramine receptor Ser-2-like [Pocillopora verrucosa]